MRRLRFRKLPPEISVEEYFEQIVIFRQLLLFFSTWVNPDRPDPKTEMRSYMTYLNVMSMIFDKEELLIEADELLAYHSGEARFYLHERQNEAADVIAPVVGAKLKVDASLIEEMNNARELRSSDLQVGFFAKKAAKRQEINEWVRIHLDDIHRGVQFIKPPLARIR